MGRKVKPMTDTEIKRRRAICEAAHVDEIDDVSDGFHTFRQLYYQRMMLFATIVKQNKDKAWKSLRHEDGELCFGGGWFIVGIDTPEGSFTYHYEDNYFSLFDCEELECGKHWDGHTEKDVTRLLSLPSAQPDHIADISKKVSKCDHENDLISRQAAIDAICTEGTRLERNGTVAMVEIKQWCVDILEGLPSAQPTLHGYNIEHLELIARVLQKEDLPPERVVEALTDIGRIVAIVRDEFEETLRRAVDQCVT